MAILDGDTTYICCPEGNYNNSGVCTVPTGLGTTECRFLKNDTECVQVNPPEKNE